MLQTWTYFLPYTSACISLSKVQYFFSFEVKFTYDEIYTTIKGQEAYLKEEYKVEEVVLYGSFVKGINRLDSDIDLLVKVSENMTYETKKKNIDNMKIYLTNLFNRFVDIAELGSIMSDSLLIELTEYKKII